MAVLSVGDEIATYLQVQVTSSTALNFNGPGTVNLFVSQMPDQPDVAVGVIERGGMPPITVLTGSGGPESKLDQPMIQIRVRSGMTGYNQGQALAQDVYSALHGTVEVRLNGPTSQLFHLISAIQSPTYLGRDTRERHGWSQNFQIMFDNDAR